jgi:hypothetical protein
MASKFIHRQPAARWKKAVGVKFQLLRENDENQGAAEMQRDECAACTRHRFGISLKLLKWRSRSLEEQLK